MISGLLKVMIFFLTRSISSKSKYFYLNKSDFFHSIDLLIFFNLIFLLVVVIVYGYPMTSRISVIKLKFHYNNLLYIKL